MTKKDFLWKIAYLAIAGGMFMIGLKSMMLAAGMLLTMTRLNGGTTRLDGATPKAHDIIAPITTC